MPESTRDRQTFVEARNPRITGVLKTASTDNLHHPRRNAWDKNAKQGVLESRGTWPTVDFYGIVRYSDSLCEVHL